MAPPQTLVAGARRLLISLSASPPRARCQPSAPAPGSPRSRHHPRALPSAFRSPLSLPLTLPLSLSRSPSPPPSLTPSSQCVVCSSVALVWLLCRSFVALGDRGAWCSAWLSHVRVRVFPVALVAATRLGHGFVGFGVFARPVDG